MNQSTIKIERIDKLIAHRINPKTNVADATAVKSNNLLTLRNDEKSILINRLHTALCHSRKTFQLDYEDNGTNSVFHKLHNQYPNSDSSFIRLSKQLADSLAESHFTTRIPGGYCLIGEGKTIDEKTFFFVIKAELQEVFNIKSNALKLIRNVFLSPAKDFYKVGFFIKSASHFTPFMYDDQFTLQKYDLTEYFYSRFLGLTTDRNDKLRSKNFYTDTKNYIDVNVSNIADKVGLLKALDVLFRENTSGIVSLREFADNHLEGDLKQNYLDQFGSRYPGSFTLQTDLIDARIDLQRVSIPLTYTIKMVGDQTSMGRIEIIDGNENIQDRILPSINSGDVQKIVILKTVEQNEDTIGSPEDIIVR